MGEENCAIEVCSLLIREREKRRSLTAIKEKKEEKKRGTKVGKLCSLYTNVSGRCPKSLSSKRISRIVQYVKMKMVKKLKLWGTSGRGWTLKEVWLVGWATWTKLRLQKRFQFQGHMLSARYTGNSWWQTRSTLINEATWKAIKCRFRVFGTNN